MILHQKNQSIKFEKGLSNLFNNLGLKAINFHSKGTDILLKNLDLFIEVKSSYRYSKYSCKYKNQTIRYSHYSFKPNEINDSIDYYIFIEKINKQNNLNYIKNLNIFVIKTKILKKYFISQNKDLTKRLQVSVNRINLLPKYNLQEFIEVILH